MVHPNYLFTQSSHHPVDSSTMDDIPASPTASESSKSNGITAIFSKSRNGKRHRNSTSHSVRSGGSEASHGFRASLEGAIDKLKRDSDSETESHGSNGLKRFVPKGFESKKKRLQREEEERRLEEEVARGRDVAERGTLENESRNPINRNLSAGSSLLTYDSENDS